MELQGGAGPTVQQSQNTSVKQMPVIGGQYVLTRLGGEQGGQHLQRGIARVRLLENSIGTIHSKPSSHTHCSLQCAGYATMYMLPQGCRPLGQG